MTCPSSDTLEQLNYAASLTGGTPLSSEMQQCYNLWQTSPSAYNAQYNSVSPAFVAAAQSNPASVLTPQPGTVPVPANNSLIGSIFNLLGQGATAYQKYQLGLTQAHVQGNGATMYVDPNLISKAQAPSSSPLPVAIGIGVGLVVLVGIVAFMAMKD